MIECEAQKKVILEHLSAGEKLTPADAFRLTGSTRLLARIYDLIDGKKTADRTERPCDYIADFVYYENGKLVVEDCKGMRTDVYKIKRKLMLEKYNISIRET